MRNAVLAVLALGLGSCGFNPDLSRFPECGPSSSCRAGSTCLTEANRCVPDCGETCPSIDGGADAGTDAGLDAGWDAGFDAGADGGTDAGDAGPALALAAVALPPAIETQPWMHGFTPTGGVDGYIFSIDGGVPNFSLSVGGVFSTSNATTLGTFPFSITVEDRATPVPHVVTTGFSLEVRPILRVANGVLVEGRQGQTYTQQLSATGGQPPYLWVVDGGMPPGNTSLTDGGLLQGTPNAAGMVSFGVTVRDSATPPQSASRMVSVDTKVLDTLFVVATRAAADGRVGTPYTQPLKAYGGVPPYTWSVISGTPPPGIGLVGAVLSGTPTMAGTFNFTVRGADTLTNSPQALTIIIY